MNQDFNLGKSSGTARMLIQLSKFCDINLDESILEKAKTGLIPVETFEKYGIFDQKEINAAQMLIDYDFRCVFPGARSEEITLVCAIVKNIFPIVVYTNAIRKRFWQLFSTKFNLKSDDFLIITKIDEEIVADNRRGILIVDTNSSYIMASVEIQAAMFDFQRVVMPCQNDKPHWISCAKILFQHSIAEIPSNYISSFHQKELESMNFNSIKSEDYLLFSKIILPEKYDFIRNIDY